MGLRPRPSPSLIGRAWSNAACRFRYNRGSASTAATEWREGRCTPVSLGTDGVQQRSPPVDSHSRHGCDCMQDACHACCFMLPYMLPHDASHAVSLPHHPGVPAGWFASQALSPSLPGENTRCLGCLVLLKKRAEWPGRIWGREKYREYGDQHLVRFSVALCLSDHWESKYSPTNNVVHGRHDPERRDHIICRRYN